MKVITHSEEKKNSLFASIILITTKQIFAMSTGLVQFLFKINKMISFIILYIILDAQKSMENYLVYNFDSFAISQNNNRNHLILI